MKKSLLFAAAFLSLTALTSCWATGYDQNDVDFTYTHVEETIVSPELSLDLGYTVRIEFIFFKSQTTLYPEIYDSFLRAVREWSTLLPIETIVAVEEDTTFSWMSSTMRGRAGVIEVHIKDIQQMRGLEKTNYIGLWIWSENRLVLDADSLDGKTELAVNVSLHELGHVFGLPHIVEQGTLKARVGDITMPPDQSPKSYLMYPSATKGSIEARPSNLEIKLARDYILHELTMPGGSTGRDHFCEH